MCLYLNSERWQNVNYQLFKTLLEAYERAHPEKNKNTGQTAAGKVWKKMKADFTAADELEEDVGKRSKNYTSCSVLRCMF